MSEKMPEEWEVFTIRVKKDPLFPYNGTTIEFNGCCYIRADLHEAELSRLKEVAEMLAGALEYYYTQIRTYGESVDPDTAEQALTAYKQLLGEK